MVCGRKNNQTLPLPAIVPHPISRYPVSCRAGRIPLSRRRTHLSGWHHHLSAPKFAVEASVVVNPGFEACFLTSRWWPPIVSCAQDAGNRGFVLQLLNAIRLQTQTLSRWAFLQVYLSSHEGWKATLPKLREDTLHKRLGMGFKVICARQLSQR